MTNDTLTLDGQTSQLLVEGIVAVSGIMHTTDWRRKQPEQARGLPAGQEFHPQWIRLLDYSMIFVGIGLLCSSLGGLIMGHARVFHSTNQKRTSVGPLTG